jgi:septal ring factor EnvC (AmiA/AmiB activator)
MPSNIDHGLADDEFGKIEAKLALIRTAATVPPDAPESWFKRTFSPAAPSSRQSEIDTALVDALGDTVGVLREKVATHLVRFEQLEQELATLRSVLASVRELQERSAATETMLAQLRQEQGEIRDRVATIGQEQGEIRDRLVTTGEQLTQFRQEQGETRDRLATTGQQLAQTGEQLAQSGREQSEKISQLAAGQGNLANELRERIQQVLDEQRVSLRQISLKTSEEAVLADRARRATELRLDELARRVPEKPA